jgi:GH24 family phage-related lysozyme (muramidase)
MTNKITEMHYTILLICLIVSSTAASTPQQVFATQQEPLGNSRQVQEALSTLTNSAVSKKLCEPAAAGASLTNMRVTSRLVEFVVGYEGNAGKLAPSERLTGDTYGLYNDFQDNCTDGIGHLVHYGKCTSKDIALHKTTFPNGQTYADAFKQFRQDLNYAKNDVIDNVKVHLTQQQFDALVDFTFNEGVNNLTNSKLLKDINAGNCDASTIKSDLQAFTRQGALIARRDDEGNMFNDGVYGSLSNN